MARPRSRRGRRPRVLLAVLLLASGTLITLSTRGGAGERWIRSVKSGVRDAFTPIQEAVDDITQPVASFLSGAVHAHSLQQENERLRQQIGRLQQQLDDRPNLSARINALEKLDHLPYANGIATVVADVTALNSSDFADTVQLDKGMSSGVDVGMPVVAGEGLLGVVTQAWSSGCTVQLLSDAGASVGVVVGDGSVTAVVDGEGAGQALRVEFIPQRTRLSKGEMLYTSSYGAAYPAGIPVARVSSFSTSSASAQEDVTAAPVADLQSPEYVAVLQWGPPV